MNLKRDLENCRRNRKGKNLIPSPFLNFGPLAPSLFPAAQHRSPAPQPRQPGRAPRPFGPASPAGPLGRQPLPRACARAQPLTPGPRLSAPPPSSRNRRPGQAAAATAPAPRASWERPLPAPRPLIKRSRAPRVPLSLPVSIFFARAHASEGATAARRSSADRRPPPREPPSPSHLRSDSSPW